MVRDTAGLPMMDGAPGAAGGQDVGLGICILNNRGTVVAVNGDVKGFLYPGQELDVWPSILGMDYFHLLSHYSSFSGFPQVAAQIAKGVRAVITSQQPTYSANCHRPEPGRQVPYRIKAEHLYRSALSVVTYQDMPVAADSPSLPSAHLDPLTGLPNRILLSQGITMARQRTALIGQHAALLLVDLDHFKDINDNFGHLVGDRLLMMVSQRLQAAVSAGGMAGRLGGDEFALLLEQMGEDAEAAHARVSALAEWLRISLSRPYRIALPHTPDMEISCTASIGVTLFKDQQHALETLLKQADLAMYSSKVQARNQVSFFTPCMEDASRQRSAIENELNHALQQGQFRLYYQIQVNRNSRPIGAEGLIRWHHPTRGIVEPQQFIPVAEQSSLICAIGKWVIREACKQLKEWEGDVNFGQLVLAVNVSGRQFRQSDFVDSVCQIIHEFKAPASKLKFELTETAIFDDIAGTATRLQQLREIGVRFSLDDFGVGYSSLLCLHDMPIDQIKIDRSFVNDIASNAKSGAIVRTLISLSRELGLSVIAEGVEREEQRLILENMGCQLQQGYLYNVPQDKEEFRKTVLGLNADPTH
ncbi:hypothetical protein HBDW_30410 [Herbaspirillum sp. DW155]|uniref:putative bifunctional diguanylate cyclase/phosphodiesterase n=1 Tax=Herbaspirillum sp. DW155 TaxID=3095609 RepID=UPI00308E3FB7|nr:hypothetical protein HBDW_30410 [Herbaspirillum sp. DW155]